VVRKGPPISTFPPDSRRLLAGWAAAVRTCPRPPGDSEVRKGGTRRETAREILQTDREWQIRRNVWPFLREIRPPSSALPVWRPAARIWQRIVHAARGQSSTMRRPRWTTIFEELPTLNGSTGGRDVCEQ